MTGGHPTELRVAVLADLDAIVSIGRDAFARPWTPASYHEELRSHDRVWLVAASAGEVIGFGGIADLAGEAHVLSVAVTVEHRRRGHGLALVTALLAAAHERFGAGRATLEVRESNLGARALYRRCGFTEAGLRPGYYQGDGEAAVVLWCDDLATTLAALDASSQADRRPRHLPPEETP